LARMLANQLSKLLSFDHLDVVVFKENPKKSCRVMLSPSRCRMQRRGTSECLPWIFRTAMGCQGRAARYATR
jgi:hypothetical protein